MSNKVSDHLHKLIRSLNTSEKRYFKLYASRHTIGEKNNYIILFDAIDRMERYDETRLLKKFKNEAFINKFSITKGRLYEVILRSLDAYHANSSIDAQLKKQLHWAEILYKKTLYDQCAKILSGAKKLAQKYERHSSVLEVLAWQKKLMEKDNYGGRSEAEMDEVLGEDEAVAERIKNFNEFWNLKSRLFILLNKSGKVRTADEAKSFRRIIDHKLLKNENQATSLESKYLFYHIYSAYYFGTGDYKKCYASLKKNIGLIESNTEYFKEEPNIFFSILTNIIYVGSQLRKYDEIFVYLDKLRKIPAMLDTSKNEDLEVKLFSSASSIELTLYVQTGDFEKGIQLAPAICDGLKKYEGKLNKLREGYFYLNLAIVYFGAGRYTESLKWLNNLLNDPGIQENQDIHCIARILDLIIHIELKNDELIPYVFRSTHRYLTTRKRVYKFENAFLDFISRFMKLKNEKRLPEIYTSLRTQMLELENDQFEKTVFEYFDFISWVEGKIQNRTFRQIVESRAALT